VELKIGEWSDKTYTKDEGGGDVLWEFLDLRCDVTPDMVTNTPLEITVWDENKGRKNALIGRATSRLIKAGASLGQEVELSVTLVDEKEKYAGRLLIFAILNNEAEDQDGVISDDFVRGELKIKRVNCFGLRNTELIGKQDPFVQLDLNDCDFHEVTPSQEDVGANPIWNHLDYSTIVNPTIVKIGSIQIKVWDHNRVGNTLIGSGEVSIRKAGCCLGGDVELRSKIADANGNFAGRVVLLANIRSLPPESSDSAISLPDSFTSGIIHFNRIAVTGLKNKEFLGKQVSFV
jgi:hypothetical protein